MLNHDYAGVKIDDHPGTPLPVLSDDILLHNGFRYVLQWANMDEWQWEDDIAYQWVPFGNEAGNAPAIEFKRDVLVPVRFVNGDGNILWRIDDE